MPHSDPQVRRAYVRAYYLKNKARHNEVCRDYNRRHPEVVREAKQRHKLKKYNLTPEQFDAMVHEQGGACAICRSVERLCVDHDHGSGVVRGLLCSTCNAALGLLGDTAETLAQAVGYLVRFERRRGEHVQ